MTTVVHKDGPHDVYIGRPSPWGNPFGIPEHGNRGVVIQKYREWILKQPDVIRHLHTLKDKTLGCYCKPKDCHGDVLVEILNSRKLAIIGSRKADNYRDLGHWILNHGYHQKDLTIISGGAQGGDAMAKRFALEGDIRYIEFPADWDKHGKKAGFMRNEDIVNNCDEVIALWDGKSKGTRHSMNLAYAQKKPVTILWS